MSKNFEVGTRWKCVDFVTYGNKVINGIIEITEKHPYSFSYKIIEGMENDDLPHRFEPHTGFAYHLHYLEEDFMKHTFTKADLKTGDVVKRRNGDVEIFNQHLGMFIRQDTGWNDIDCLQDDLSNLSYKAYDIIAVRRPVIKSDCAFDAFENKCGTLVYERQEVEEMTLEQVCQLLGREIKIIK